MCGQDDGEGADVALRSGCPGGATGTSLKPVQPMGQQGVGPVHFLPLRCSVSDVSDIALARNHCISINCFFPLAFYYHKVGCGPKLIFWPPLARGKEGFRCSSVLHRQVKHPPPQGGDGEPSWLLPTE